MPEQQAHHPSQVLKFCPFCGSEGFTWENGKRMRCSRCNRQLYINEAAAVVAIIENEKGELLFTRRKHDPKKGMLDLPGGFVDIGEKAENAVRREVKEELNLDVEQISFVGSFPNEYIFGGITYFTLDLAFHCKVNSLSNIQAADDVADYLFTSIDKINLNDVGLNSIKTIVRLLKSNH